VALGRVLVFNFILQATPIATTPSQRLPQSSFYCPAEVIAIAHRLPTPGPFNPAVVFGRNFRGQERFFAGSTDPHTGGLCLGSLEEWGVGTSSDLGACRSGQTWLNKSRQSWLSLAKSHCPLKYIVPTGSGSEQYQLINVVDKRHA
jgi:hypothetical protein